MRRPTDQEEAALVAAFSFTDAIDAICAPVVETTSKRKKRRCNSVDIYEIVQGPIWRGWCCIGDELFDSGGNSYGYHEICALFYQRRVMGDMRRELERLRPPPPKSEPEQLTLALTPAWKLLATR